MTTPLVKVITKQQLLIALQSLDCPTNQALNGHSLELDKWFTLAAIWIGLFGLFILIIAIYFH